MKPVQVIMGELVQIVQDAKMADILYNLQQVTDEVPVVTEINYQCCHEREISTKLASWAQDPVLQLKKFPLVWVREDLQFGNQGDFRTVRFPSIIIAWPTDTNYESAQREVQSFVPVLRVIYHELIRQITRCRYFRIENEDTDIPHNYFERKHWGTSDDKTENVFTAPVDAIEILNLELTLNEFC